MDLRIKATDITLTPDIQSYLESRLASLEKLLGNDATVARFEVELGRDTGHHRHSEHMWFAEITVRVPGGPFARAINRAQSINAAIDDVKEEAERQLRKEKKLHKRILRKTGTFAKRLLRME